MLQVLALVEVDVSTWFISMVVVAIVTGICLALDSVNAQLMQCFCCWGLFTIGLIYYVVLEEDTWELTPQVPEDPREVLRLFSGTSIQMLRRSSWLGRSPEEAVAKILSLSGRRFRPMMPGVDGKAWPRIRPTPREELNLDSAFYLVQDYTVAFKLLCFLQAAVVASLIVELLNGSIHGPDRTIPFALASIEWPLMLFWLVPSFSVATRRFCFFHLGFRKRILRKKKQIKRRASIVIRLGPAADASRCAHSHEVQQLV